MSTWNRWRFMVIRNELGMSQTEAGEWLGVSQNWIENWESGNFRPNSHTMQMIAQKIAQKRGSKEAFAVTGVRVNPSVILTQNDIYHIEGLEMKNPNTMTICQEAGLTVDEIKQLDEWISGYVERDDMLGTTTYNKLFEYFARTKKTMPKGVIKADTMCPCRWILEVVRWNEYQSNVNVDFGRVDLNLMWKQKLTLLDIIRRHQNTLSKDQVDDLNGLLNLAHHITDQWPVPFEYREVVLQHYFGEEVNND